MESSDPESDIRGYHVTIVRRSRARPLSDRRILLAVQHVLRHHRIRGCDLEVAILGRIGITRLNEQWLGHDGPTDAIAFDLGARPARETGLVVGQVNVCWPIAEAQAARRGIAPAAELLLYIVHGTLHLLGYDDHEPAAARRMHRQEDRLLEQLGCGPVYGQRSD